MSLNKLPIIICFACVAAVTGCSHRAATRVRPSSLPSPEIQQAMRRDMRGPSSSPPANPQGSSPGSK